LAGPVVAACVALPQGRDLVGLTQELAGIRDSKRLTPGKREKIYAKIKENIPSVGIGVTDAPTIDRINVLQATFLAMKKAITAAGIKAGLVLVDGSQSIPNLSVRQSAVPQADSKLMLVAAASVIAKVERDWIMFEADKKYPEYGFAKHKGYGTKAHMQKIKQLGACPMHRRSFAGVMQA